MAGQYIKRSDEGRVEETSLPCGIIAGPRGPAGGEGPKCSQCGLSTWVELAGGPSDDAYHPNIDRIPCLAWVGSGHLPDECLKKENVDIVHDLTTGIPLHDNHAVRLKMIDVFNFFTFDEAKAFLKEALRVLAPGGSFFIRTVDLEWVMKQINKYGLSRNWLEVIYGSPGSAGLIGHHRWGYSFYTLKEMLEECGFTHVVHHGFYNYHEMKVEAWKPNTTNIYELQQPHTY